MDDPLGEILKYAREKFREEINALLDDPSWLLIDEGDGIDPPAHLADRRRFAGVLGLDLDAIIEEEGSSHDKDRLRALMGP